MAPDRHLPKKFNSLMTEGVPSYEILVARRRLGQSEIPRNSEEVRTPCPVKSKSFGALDYAHLRVPIPKGIVSGIFNPIPSSYFLMRRSHDGYVSATGMFKATFPSASLVEEELERKYIRGLASTSPDETVNNVWIPPQFALELAEEYKILPWIKALLDSRPIELTTAKVPVSNILAPPPFLPHEEISEPTTLCSSARLRRSASPSKNLPRKACGTRSQTQKVIESKIETKIETIPDILPPPITSDDSEIVLDTLPTLESIYSEDIPDAIVSEIKSQTSEILDISSDPAPTESSLRVSIETETETEIDTDTEKNAGKEDKVITNHALDQVPQNIQLPPSPTDTEEMIAKAKEMVELAAQEDDTESIPRIPKRKVEELEVETDDESGEGNDQEFNAKRRKIEARELKKEKIKSRALLGITATLVFGAAIQYAFSAI